jgi:hypothetical protein
MPLLAYRKSTGQPLSDFQRSATLAGLTANAVRTGVDLADLDIRTLSDAEYDAAETAFFAAARADADTQVANLRTAAQALRVKMGLTVAELRLLAYLVSLGNN